MLGTARWARAERGAYQRVIESVAALRDATSPRGRRGLDDLQTVGSVRRLGATVNLALPYRDEYAGRALRSGVGLPLALCPRGHVAGVLAAWGACPSSLRQSVRLIAPSIDPCSVKTTVPSSSWRRQSSSTPGSLLARERCPRRRRFTAPCLRVRHRCDACDGPKPRLGRDQLVGTRPPLGSHQTPIV